MARSFIPSEIAPLHDVVSHGATIPSGAWPRRAQPLSRPPSAPSASSSPSRFASTAQRFWTVAAARSAVRRRRHRRHRAQHRTLQTLLLWALRAALRCRVCACVTAPITGGCSGLAAFAVAFVVFLPFPILLRLYILPGVALFGLVGLSVPAAVAERLGFRAAIRPWHRSSAVPTRARDRRHRDARASSTASAACFLLVLLHTQGNQTQAIALVLANLVLSPLLFSARRCCTWIRPPG